jgi:hypothetical protein
LRLELVGRFDNRWKLRLELPPGVPLSSITVGLVDETGRNLGAAVVEQGPFGAVAEVAVRGPCSLPAGTRAQVILQVEGEGSVVHHLRVARRSGLHAWLHADARLPLESRAEFADLSNSERRRLGDALCFLVPASAAEAGCGCEESVVDPVSSPTPPPKKGCVADDLMDLLGDLGVDTGDLAADFVQQLRGR